MKPRLLDLYCCAGGAARGYQMAGFHVVGVDNKLQRHYCGDEWDLRDAVEAAYLYGHLFDAIHASPPCQHYSLTQRIQKNDHPDLIAPTREALEATGKPYVIENVVDARDELKNPVELCGAMFGLRTYRHRLFESNFDLEVPDHPEHVAKQTKMGRRLKDGEFMHIVGHFSGVDTARGILGTPWMTRDEMAECIPPAYTEHVGKQLMAQLS